MAYAGDIDAVTTAGLQSEMSVVVAGMARAVRQHEPLFSLPGECSFSCRNVLYHLRNDDEQDNRCNRVDWYVLHYGPGILISLLFGKGELELMNQVACNVRLYTSLGLPSSTIGSDYLKTHCWHNGFASERSQVASSALSRSVPTARNAAMNSHEFSSRKHLFFTVSSFRRSRSLYRSLERSHSGLSCP